MFVEFFGGLAF